jgi:hypothetical protein
MPSVHNISLSDQRTVDAALALLDQHKQGLTEIIESDETTPDEKYDALVALAYMTGVLRKTVESTLEISN